MNKNLLASIIIGVALFLIFFLIAPEYDAIQAARAAITDRQALLQERTNDFNNFTALDQQYKDHINDIQKIATFVPQTKHVDGLISSVQAIAQQTGIQTTGIDITTGVVTVGAPYQTATIHLGGTGSYSAMMSFLQALETSLRIFDVTSFNLAPQGITSSLLTMSISLNAYYLK